MSGDRTDSVSVRAPAKINLDLSVGALGDDGFHPVSTVYHAVSVFDDVTVTPTGGGLELEVTGEHTDGVPLTPDNLVLRAAQLVARRGGVQAGARILLHKGIPVAAGMAGGSADAAAALVACDAAWRTGLDRAELLELAAQLGADVAFALVGGTAIGAGRGEQITPALARGQYHWVLALSEDGLSTPAVYAEFDRLTAGRALAEPRVGDEVMQALRSGDCVALGKALRNDLQPAAFSLRPDLSDLLEVGLEYGALGGVVSGSGPTLAFLVRDHEHALDLSVALTASGACEVVKRAHGPVHGARVGDLPRLT
ncbi:4-(cytidine 5'-diphospho)-2-C-methyl-D-erythritol kinase [Angustibacter luteus]|uniref:4-diphosphocytidyl-2-C-methyl-D-erythritol kinase n=1 Tax=Angustibacter luteus TaxID=658456 RepID=A0ABW1JB45_9ACTN